jgi:hypothetical protein
VQPLWKSVWRFLKKNYLIACYTTSGHMPEGNEVTTQSCVVHVYCSTIHNTLYTYSIHNHQEST